MIMEVFDKRFPMYSGHYRIICKITRLTGPWNNSIGHDSTTPIETEPIRLLLALPEEKLLNGLHIL
jgi:hypothetical protein